jgi:signal recognition particle subunit SRP54
MVLAELGGKLRESLRKLQNSSSGIDTAALNDLLSELSRALIESDVNVNLVMTLRENIKNRVGEAVEKHEQNQSANSAIQNIKKLVQKAVMDELTSLLTPKKNKPFKMKRNKPNVILFVGLQGAGKTTSIAKFANFYSRKGWKTAMVCADTFRAGAFDQLKQNATKLRIPFYGSYTEADPVAIAEDGVEQFVKQKYEVIIVDTSGRHRQEGALFEEMQEISASIRPDNTIFVMDATQGQAVYDQALAFQEAVDVGSVIVTKLDGHAKGGGALSAVAATQSPILFLGSGEKFDDFELFNAHSFVSKLLGMGDVRGFLDEMKEVHDTQDQEELRKKMQKGEFTLRDMYKQFQQTLTMSPMSKLMGGNNGDEETKRLKKFMYMMDSMTDAELDGKVDMHNKHGDDTSIQSRIIRIAKGSGTHPNEVKMLLQTHKQMQGMVSKMGKSGMLGKGNNARQKNMMENFKKNPAALMSHLNRMDPRVIQQMGGRDAVMQMMKDGGMPGGDGMPDMASMMQSLGGGGMPDMATMARMMQNTGMGRGGGIPDMATMARMMKDMKMGGR